MLEKLIVSFDRRELLKGVLFTAATGAVACQAASATGQTTPTAADAAPTPSAGRPWPVVDVNVSLFNWPFRRLPYDTPDALVEKLRTLHIQQAWAGSFEGLLQRDLRGVNDRLAEACGAAPDGLLLPFGSINPQLPDWEADLRRCHEVHQMPGIRLHPGYHGYTLADERFARLFAMAAERNLLVQLAASMEDGRTQPVQLQAPDVDLAPLSALVPATPGARLMLLNYKPRANTLAPLAQLPGVVFDTARVDGTDGIARLIEAVSPQRVVYGTHAPFLIFESGLIKVYESTLNESQVGLLLAENARRWLARA